MTTWVKNGYVYDDTVSSEAIAKIILPDDHRDVVGFEWLVKLDESYKARVMQRAFKQRFN
jgi:hypothetical protein